MNPEDAKLRGLLQENRETPALPPRFREGVWSRIEKAERGARRNGESWADVVLAWLLRPRAAFAIAACLLVAGAILGARDGIQVARHEAQAHYLAAVAPNSLR